MKQGDILETKLKNADGEDLSFAIEYCRSSGGKSMSVGALGGMVDKGEWQADKQPKLPESYSNYKVVYRIGFLYQGFKFLAEYLTSNKKEFVWFVKSYYKEFNDDLLVFSDEVRVSPYWNLNPYDNMIPNKKIKMLMDTFRESNIFYSDNLTGTDFKKVINFLIKK